MRRRQSGLLLAAALGLVACAYRAPVTGQAQAGFALPPGQGRGILERECLNCHELEAIELFSDFYDRERWRSLVLTMRDNGAEIDDGEVEIVAEYLARYFGTGGG